MIYNTISQRDKDFTIARLTKQLEHYKKIVEILNDKAVQDIFIKWQGKTYNKRFLTALNKLHNYFNVDTRFGLYLEFCFYNDRCITMENYKRSYGGCEVTYIDGRYGVTCLSKNTLYDEKTIIDDLNDKMQALKEHYIKAYDELNEQLKNLDNIINQFNEIKEIYNTFENATNYTIRQELGLTLQLSR